MQPEAVALCRDGAGGGRRRDEVRNIPADAVGWKRKVLLVCVCVNLPRLYGGLGMPCGKVGFTKLICKFFE